jgi:hypothetical protein
MRTAFLRRRRQSYASPVTGSLMQRFMKIAQVVRA